MISSPRNPKVVAASRLRKRATRDQERRFLIEGVQAVGEALARDDGLERLFFTPSERVRPVVDRARTRGTPTLELSPEVMARLTSTVTPQGIAGVGPYLDVPLSSLAQASLWVVLCAARDPGNAGTVLRSADAAGADAVVFADSSVDLYNPKTVRASAGSLFHVPVVRGVDAADAVQAARSHGMAVYAMAADGATDLYALDLERPSAFLVGNEAWGLHEGARNLADTTVRIPIAGRAESLNMAAAASVCLFEAARQRAAGPSMDSVVAGAAHDIRSPLTALRNMAEVLLQTQGRLTPADRDAMLHGIVRDADQTDAILRSLVDASRILHGTLQVRREPFELSTVVGTLIERLRFDPGHPEIVWEGEAVSVNGDEARVASALAAFVEATVWWCERGPIHVSAKGVPRWSVLEVRREGPTVAVGEIEGLFRPRRPGTGSGSKIGLFVARGVAEAHGGTVTASVDADGLHLRLKLPR